MDKAATLDKVSWYAVSTRSRQEKTAAFMLESFAIETFLPLVTERRQWSDRLQVVSVPLFPGYLFVRVPMLRDVQLQVLKVPGVVRFMGNQSGPQAVPDAEIAGVQAVLSHRIPCTPCPMPRVGDRVRISRGVLAGIEGTFVRSGPETHLVISVEMIQQSISVQVDASDLELAFCPSPATFAGVKPALAAEYGL